MGRTRRRRAGSRRQHAAHRAGLITVIASAPVRVCDLGGWTDTWFGGPGRLLHLAAGPGVRVSIRPAGGSGQIVLDVTAFDDRYAVVPGEDRHSRHPLLEAALDTLPPSHELGVEIEVSSSVPPGCGTGTSAAVTVAMLGALAAWRGEVVTPVQLAYAAHALEVDILKMESGIQDHLAAALGGTNFLTIDEYPIASVEVLPLWDQLHSRLTHVYLGRAHVSDDVHRFVIDDTSARRASALARLRQAAQAGRAALLARDLAGFGGAMVANSDAQRALHPDLVGPDAARVIALANEAGALGWKINGAGGDGGSVTLLSRDHTAKAELDTAITGLDERFALLPLEVNASGLAVTRDSSA